MSSYSKWATTKHKKAAIDAKCDKLFARLVRNIEVAARAGGGDPVGNPTLFNAIQKARKPSVSTDSIERTVKCGSGAESRDADWQSITYEGYRSNGVGFIVGCLTDNKNRVVSEVHTILSRNGGNVADTGSVSYQFTRRGVIEVAKTADLDEDKIFEVVMEAGVDDVEDAGETFVIEIDSSDLVGVRTALQKAGIDHDSAESQFIPSVGVDSDLEGYHKIMRLFDMLDGANDVQNVYMDGDVSDEVIPAYEAKA